MERASMDDVHVARAPMDLVDRSQILNRQGAKDAKDDFGALRARHERSRGEAPKNYPWRSWRLGGSILLFITFMFTSSTAHADNVTVG